MSRKYYIDFESQVEEKRRRDLIEVLNQIQEMSRHGDSEYIADTERISVFNLIADHIKAYFENSLDVLVDSSIDEDCTGGLITIASKNTLDLMLTEDIKLLMKLCSRMDVSPHNNGVIKLEFSFLNFQKRVSDGRSL